MENFEQMLQGVLSDPKMMEQIMGLARSLGADPGNSGSPEAGSDSQSSGPDSAAMGQLAGLLKKSGIDGHQQALLTALTPYVSSSRIRKLRRAMEAARVAQMASSLLGASGQTGR